MGYSIQYEAPKTAMQKYVQPRKKPVMLIVFLVILVACSLIPQAGHWLQQLVFPGSSEQTLAILEQSVADIRAGESVKEAIYTFCREIIANG